MRVGPFELGRYQTEIEKGLPKDPDAYLDRARKFLKEKRYEDSEKLTKIALELRPDFLQALSFLGEIYNKSGRKKEGKEIQNEAKNLEKLRAKAMNELRENARRHFGRKTNDSRFWLALAAQEIRQRSEPLPIEVCIRESIRINSKSFEAWDMLGFLLRNTMRYREAEDAYRKVTQLKGSYAGAWHNLGVTLADRGKIEEAEKMLSKSLSIDSSDASTWADYGVILKRAQKYSEAEKALRRSLEIKPNDPNTTATLTTVLATLGKKDEAESLIGTLDTPRDDSSPKVEFKIGKTVESVEAEDLNSDESFVLSIIASQNAISPESAFGPFMIPSPPFVPEILNPLRDKGYIGLTKEGGMYLTEKGRKMSIVK